MAVHIQQQAHMACVCIIVTKPQTIMCDIAVITLLPMVAPVVFLIRIQGWFCHNMKGFMW